MQFLHASPATRSIVTALRRSGAPVIPERSWCTYPCPEPLFDGSPLTFDEATDDAIRAAVALGADQNLVTVMHPVPLPRNADMPLTLNAGFTVMAGGNGQLYSFQCVLTVKGIRRYRDSIAETASALFVVMDVENASAWDLNNHGRGVRRVAI